LKMNKSVWIILAFILIVLFAFGRNFFSIYLHYDTTPPEIIDVSPYGESSSPATIDYQSEVTLEITVKEDVGEVESVWCEVYELDTFGKWVLKENVSGFRKISLTKWTRKWIAPVGKDLSLKLSFKAVNTAGLVASRDSYVIVSPSGIPNGVFYVNGVKIEDGGSITIRKPDLTFKFIATEESDQIQNVIVHIDKAGYGREGDVYLVRYGSTTWEKEYTLKSGPGNYILTIEIEYTEPAPPPSPSPPGSPPVESIVLMKMTISLSSQTQQTPPEEEPEQPQGEEPESGEEQPQIQELEVFMPLIISSSFTVLIVIILAIMYMHMKGRSE